jgi:UDP-N-acetylmuramate--alanine ligase
MSYHFIGIGGIGMSSLAKLLLQSEASVKGSDPQESDLFVDLRKRGAKIYRQHKEEHISDGDIVVYSSAIKENNPELMAAKAKNLSIIHRSELLSWLLKGYLPLLVAGTHGKTTTSSLLSLVLLDAGIDPCYYVGGILNSTGTNANRGGSKYFVVEADESDGSFLNYSGYGAIILNIEKEHMSYWKNEKNLKKGFSDFIGKIEKKEFLVWCKEDPVLRELNPPGESFGFTKEADIFADNIKEDSFQMIFDINYKNKRYEGVRLNLVGKHNVLNALSVFLLSKKLGIEERSIFRTFLNFQGVKRRMDKIGEINKTLFLDDYAHHPSEIKATLLGLRQAVKERRIVAVFQPHRYSRTRELFEDFASSFKEVDELLVTDIYSAGEDEKDKISSEALVDKIREEKKNVKYISQEKLFSSLSTLILPHDVIIFMGAGDITKIGRTFFDLYKKKPSKLKLALLFGGKSYEHEVSKLSAKSVYENLDKSIYDITLFYIDLNGNWALADDKLQPIGIKEGISSEVFSKLVEADICFPMFHGPCGEDGMVQGFLDTLNKPYVGPSYASCACSMNKAWAKYVAGANEIPTLDFVEITKILWKEKRKDFTQKILQKLTLPIFIKPSHLGSSVGVKKLDSFKNLEQEIDIAFTYDDSLIVEQGVVGREIEVAVLGNTFVEAATVGEVLTGGLVYDYERKYGKNGFQTIVPANIPQEKAEKVQAYALKLYKLIGLVGMARIDFFFVGEKIFFNEVNPIPGFTSISLYPKMWIKSGLEYKDLLDRLIVLGRHKKMSQV